MLGEIPDTGTSNRGNVRGAMMKAINGDSSGLQESNNENFCRMGEQSEKA